MGLLGETANPSALGSHRKYDAWACQGTISKWALLPAVPLSRASEQLSGIVWDFSYWGLVIPQQIEDGGAGGGGEGRGGRKEPLCAIGLGALG